MVYSPLLLKFDVIVTPIISWQLFVLINQIYLSMKNTTLKDTAQLFPTSPSERSLFPLEQAKQKRPHAVHGDPFRPDPMTCMDWKRTLVR
jgi:hypothetical protein